MAKEWDISRTSLRPFHFKIIKGVKKGDKILDVGCGNALLYDILADKSIDYTGIDVSKRLLEIAKKRVGELKRNQKLNSLNFKFVKGNVIKLPFGDNKFDWVFALAILHHLPSREYREKAVREIYRVLKSGGRVTATVWNLYSNYAKEKFKIKEQLKNKPDGWGPKDLIIPWKATPGKKIARYVYSFDEKEFIHLFKTVGFKKIVVSYRDQQGRQLKDKKTGFFLFLAAQK